MAIFSKSGPKYFYKQDDEAKRKEHRKKWDQALGSFQFQVLNSRLYPSIDISVIELIESKRHKTDTIYLPYTKEIRIMILPESVINGEYKKLEHIKHIITN